MKKRYIRSLAVGMTAIGLVLSATPVLAGYDEHDAVRDCRRSLESRYGYRDVYNIRTEHRGHHNKYMVTGKVRIRHDKDRRFRCKTKNKQVVKLTVDGEGSYGGGYGGNYSRRDRYYGHDHYRDDYSRYDGYRGNRWNDRYRDDRYDDYRY